MNWNLGYCCKCGNTEGPWTLHNNRWYCEDCYEKEKNPKEREKEVLRKAIHNIWFQILERNGNYYNLPMPEEEAIFQMSFDELHDLLQSIRENIEEEIEKDEIWNQ